MDVVWGVCRVDPGTRQLVGFGDLYTGKGNFWGECGEPDCNQWGVCGVAVWKCVNWWTVGAAVWGGAWGRSMQWCISWESTSYENGFDTVWCGGSNWPRNCALDDRTHHCHLANTVERLWMDLPPGVATRPVPQLVSVTLLVCQHLS